MYNSIYPLNIKPYVPPQPRAKGTVKEKEDEESSASSYNLNRESQRTEQNNSTDPNGRSKYSYQEFPNGQRTTIDYSKSKVNIAQILTDFKNTAIAIGSPPKIINEVEQYLSIAEAESLKGDPNKKRIQSNLKNASNVLDEFISKTLDKKSKVVENWIDALFLQQVDYKSDPTTINPDFLVKLPDKETGDMKPISETFSAQAQPTQVQSIEQPNAQPTIQEIEVEQTQPVQKQTTIVEEQAATELKQEKNIYIPENQEIKRTFIQGKKYVAINNNEKAIDAFKATIELAQMFGDNNAEGMACFELGQIYDKDDNLQEALKYYNQAHRASNDNNLKAKAYYSMAKIYDDVVYFEPAMNHYYAAISFAGEAENLNAQTKALSDIGDMYAERYNVEKTYEYYNLAKNIALETHNDKVKGAIWSRSGDAMVTINENVSALKDYKTSAQYYEKTESPIKMARNYEKAAEVMLALGNREKAQSLLNKAQKFAAKASNTEYEKEIAKRLNV